MHNKKPRINRSLQAYCKQLRGRELLKEVDIQFFQGLKSKYFIERKVSDKSGPRALGTVTTLGWDTVDPGTVDWTTYLNSYKQWRGSSFKYNAATLPWNRNNSFHILWVSGLKIRRFTLYLCISFKKCHKSVKCRFQRSTCLCLKKVI